MIFDRTRNDVVEALKIRETKIKNFEELSEKDREILEKGFLTINTLNRIEQKATEISNSIKNMGYFGFSFDDKKWEEEEIFDENNFRKLIHKVRLLKNAFLVYATTPKIPSATYYYTVFNDLEKILFDIDKMIYEIKDYYRECGTFESGA